MKTDISWVGFVGLLWLAGILMLAGLDWVDRRLVRWVASQHAAEQQRRQELYARIAGMRGRLW